MALDFDGTDDYIDCGQRVGNFASNEDASFSCYIKINSLVSNAGIFSRSRGFAPQIGYHLRQLSTGALRFIVYSGGNDYFGIDSSVLSSNTWYHVTAQWTKSGTPKLWLNGIEQTSTLSLGTIGTLQGTANFEIGRNFEFNSGPSVYLNGQVDDFRCYTRLITPAEIRQLASRRGIGLQSTPRHTDYLETREKTYSVIVKSQQEHSSLSEGLVGAWCPSLGATGYRLIDRSGYGNHGTLTNMTSDDWVVSGGAGALDFDGVNDYVDCGVNAGNLTEKSTFSVSAWALARQTGGANTFRGLISRAQSSPYPFSIRFNTSGSVLRLVTDDTELLGPTITANQWFHITVVLAPSSRKIYFNGNLVTESTASYSITANDNKLYIGTDYVPQSDRVWDGQVDDVRIYNRALTPPEIRLLASKRGIGLRSQKQTMFYQFPSGSKRRRLLTGMP
jgi:hypothetical protein